MNIQFLLTGSELMAGDIVDTNSVNLSQSLKQHGIEIQRKVTVADEFTVLINEINIMSQQADILIVNGGLGPTEDDLTAEALAKVLGVEIEENAESKAHLEFWCDKRGFRLDKANMKQAMLPEGVDIVPNPIGSAVGFSITHNDCLIVCTPGVPTELNAMWQETILPLILNQQVGDHFSRTEKFLVFGLGEAPIQDRLSHIDAWPENVELGFRAAPPIVEVKLTIRKSEHQVELDQCIDYLHEHLGAHVVSQYDEGERLSLESHLVKVLVSKQQQVTFAESCTGGLIASRCTTVPGSSAVFEVGYVTYSNRIKTQLLGVEESVLQSHGAVSQPVVEQMLQGALQQSGADIGIAVSGIAGPGGGGEDKPVGTVWLAWGSKDNHQSVELFYPAPREHFQNFVAAVGLDLLRRHVLNIEERPAYFSRTRK